MNEVMLMIHLMNELDSFSQSLSLNILQKRSIYSPSKTSRKIQETFGIEVYHHFWTCSNLIKNHHLEHLSIIIMIFEGSSQASSHPC